MSMNVPVRYFHFIILNKEKAIQTSEKQSSDVILQYICFKGCHQFACFITKVSYKYIANCSIEYLSGLV